MTAHIRGLRPSDHPFIISVIDRWWGGRSMAGRLPRLFFEHFADTSFAAERGGGLGRRLYLAFFAAAAARGCTLVRAVTSPVNRGSVAFHRAMGFRLEPGDHEVDGIPVTAGYDGPGGDRVRFTRRLGDSDPGQATSTLQNLCTEICMKLTLHAV